MEYKIKIDEFEGPLDLLLHLIKESNIDIYDISIEKITKQYMDYINAMEDLNINIASSYLVMAAELMEIKSRSLLPNNKDEVTEDDSESSKENLINKLIEYKKYKEVSETFKELESNRKNIFVKPPEMIDNYTEEHIVNDTDIGVDDLLKAFSDFLQRKEMEKPLNTKITNKEYSVKERKNYIKNTLLKKRKVEFEELFEEYNRSYIIVTFISLLEMCKEKSINIKQDNNFDKIFIELR